MCIRDEKKRKGSRRENFAGQAFNCMFAETLKTRTCDKNKT